MVLEVLEIPKDLRRDLSVSAAKKAIGCAGGSAECARKLNKILPENESITTQAVDKWLYTGIPPKRVLLMELIQGRVDRYDMQPEVYGERP